MTRSIDAIQRDIERTRTQLASTLDELAGRTRPQALMNDAKTQVTDSLRSPKVLAVIGGIAAVVAGGIALAVSNNKKKDRELDRIKELLQSARD
ncbi:DUF3618 domain-containing protein [Corynebacterium ulceribovis]|uniref:DUF3618 domain-containing protein n=1 Tax=Corynebacterium ulceribovis TaxID=487732 RepID=UPI000365DFED|nr:DUF3618 domain-containing protein [Corynebacterium ulceribovis]